MSTGDLPVQPGETSFVGSHSYAVTLLTQLLQGRSFSQTPENSVGDEFNLDDLFDTNLVNPTESRVDVETYDSPIKITTLASIEGGAEIIVGTTPISPTESASVLVRAVDHTNLTNRITTGTLSDLTEYDFVVGKIGLQRDTRAYIGSADPRTTLLGLNDSSAGVVKVSAENLGNVTGEVFSDFLEYQSSTFARDSVLAHVQNADLNVQGLEVTARNSSAYATVAEENSNTVRGVTTAHVVDSTVMAVSGGVTLSAVDETSYSATSNGQGSRSSLNDVRKDVTAHAAGSTITVTNGSIHITADNRTAFNATSTLTPTESDSPFASLFATAGILATNVVNGDVLAYAEGSTLTTTTAGSIFLQADNAATIDARVKGQATATSGLPVAPALSFGAAVAFNAIGWDAFNVLLATMEDFVGAPSNDWIEEILPFAESTPARAHAYLLDTRVAAADDLTIQARSAAQINATVSNAAESTASSLYGTFSAAAGGVLASNKISSSTEAWIHYSDAYQHDPESDDISAGGTISLLASDDAGIYANCKIVSSSMTTNDGGASFLQEGMNYLIPADFLSSEGDQEIEFGDRVRLTSDYDSSRGTPDAVYQYLGTTATLNLADTDYTDLGLWKPVPVSNLVPQGYNVSGSSAIALGGLVVLNEVRSDVQAYVGVNAAEDGAAPHAATVTAAAVTVTALENATIFATADSTAAASGGSAFGTGTVIAVNGTIATNVVLSQANAYVSGSDITTTAGDLTIQARNNSQIDAQTLSATTSGDTAVGVVLAFNTIGWQAQNVLFNTLDALLGDPVIASALGDAEPAQVQAYILNSDVDAAGGITLSALNLAQINAVVGNEATAAAVALFGANATTAAGVLASNMVNSQSRAYLQDDDSSAGRTVQAGQAIGIEARDSAVIDARTRLAAMSSASNDGGAGILNSLAKTLIENYQYTTHSGDQTVTFGQQVRVAEGYDPAKGTPGKVYQYMGTSAEMDLGQQDYTDYELWKELDTGNVVPQSVSTAALKAFELDPGTASSYYALVARNDVRGAVEAFIDNADVTAQGDISLIAVEGAHIRARDNSVVSAKTGGKGGVIATNSLQSHADAYLKDTVVSASGALRLDAQNTAQIEAVCLTASEAKASVGVVVAFNQIGWRSSNIFFQAIDALLGTDLLGAKRPVAARAYIQDSTVDAAGEISLSAQSLAQLQATTGNEQVAHRANEFVIAAKFGMSSMSAGALLASNKVSSEAKAYIDDTDPDAGRTIRAGSGMTLSARDDASIESDSKVVSSAVTSNTLDGLKEIAKTLGLTDYQYTTASGTKLLLGGENVRLGADYANGGDTGSVYRWLGGPAELDLGAQNYADPVLWAKFAGGAADPTDLLFPNIGNLTDSDARAFGFLVVMNDVRGAVQASINAADVTVTSGDLILEAIENATIAVRAETNVTASGGSLYGTGTVVAAGGQAVTNVVLSSADAFITDSDITMNGGNVRLDARNTAGIDATLLTSTASGDTAVGVSLAFNTIGWKSQNILFNTIDALIGAPAIADRQPAEANAYVRGGTLTNARDVTLTAENSAQLNATVSNAARSTASALYGAVGKGIGGVLASNKVASGAHAYLETPAAPVTLAGALTITAEDNAGIYANAKIVSSSITTNDGGAAAIQETIDDLVPADFLSSEGSRQIEFGDRVRIADDYISGNYTSDQGEQLLVNGDTIVLADDYAVAKFTSDSGRRLLVKGDFVQLADDYAGGGTAGAVYRYLGENGRVDLGAQDYGDAALWAKVGGEPGAAYRYLGAAGDSTWARWITATPVCGRSWPAPRAAYTSTWAHRRRWT
jgi:hypothetical protein